MIEVIMPKMGDAMEEGTLVDWVKKEGDKVNAGDVIGNIQTDKATVELTAPASGVLQGILLQPGETVPVGQPIAAILKEGESLPPGWGNGKAAAKQAAEPQPVAAEKATAELPEPATKTVAVVESPPGERVFASPLARKLAAEAGIPIEGLAGTGPGGRIVERDVRRAMQETARPRIAVAPEQELRERVVPLTNLQRITAQRVTQSKIEVPHYYVTLEIDLENLVNLRETMNREKPDDKLSINDFVIKASALALQDQPHINASWEDGKMRMHGAINIGVAVAVPDGLTVPVIKNCERKPLREIAREARALAAKAKENKLTPEELSGSTFTISNMGMYGVDDFSAIINQPNGAIIAVAAAKRVPVVVEGEDGEELEIRSRMKVTGSFDHRIINGAQGAEFMGVLRKYLESPTLLIT